MVKWLIPLILILCPLAGYGQFGASARYLFGQSESLDSLHLSQDGMHVSLTYSIGLKDIRLMFNPGVGYRTTWQNPDEEGYFTAFDLDLNTALYPFDFGGGCDCPTFSKEGNVIKKGLFLEFNPGISYQTLHRTDVVIFEPGDPVTDAHFVWKIGASVGLDIGLSEQFTLTPMFSWAHISSQDYKALLRDGSTGTLDDQSYLAAGLRFIYTPDPKRLRRR